jgi:nicotinate-nucleotide adenylyltransferase
MSYTIDTLREIAALHPEAELFLIIGADQFDNFMLWRSFDKIFEIANVVVTSRPGAHLPARLEELPARLRDYVEIFDADEATLTTGRLVKFLALNDIDISASEIRRRIRARQSVDKFLAPRAIEYIEKHRLYAPYSDRVRDFAEFTRFCANQLFERKAIQVRAFDLRELDKPSEFALIGSGSSTRHTSALADYVLRRVKEEFGFYPYNIEGQSEGRWVVLDYGALILHLFYDFARSEYKLEDLWKDGRELQLTDPFAARSEAPDASAIPHVPNKS